MEGIIIDSRHQFPTNISSRIKFLDVLDAPSVVNGNLVNFVEVSSMTYMPREDDQEEDTASSRRRNKRIILNNNEEFVPHGLTI